MNFMDAVLLIWERHRRRGPMASGLSLFRATNLLFILTGSVSYQVLEGEGKAIIIVGDATETVDKLYPYYRLIEGGFEPVV